MRSGEKAVVEEAGKRLLRAAGGGGTGYRNKGYGRALLECIEEVSRALGLGLLMLCSTDDPVTKNTWRALGFSFTTDDDLRRFGVHTCDLLHMDNTVQARLLPFFPPPPGPLLSLLFPLPYHLAHLALPKGCCLVLFGVPSPL